MSHFQHGCLFATPASKNKYIYKLGRHDGFLSQVRWTAIVWDGSQQTWHHKTATVDETNRQWVTCGLGGAFGPNSGSGVTNGREAIHSWCCLLTLHQPLLFSYLILGLEWGAGCRKRRKRTKQRSEKQSILETFKHDVAFFSPPPPTPLPRQMFMFCE